MNNKETIDNQDKIIQLLEEILIWTRLQGVQNARDVLIDALKTDTLKLAYHLSDGSSSAEVSKACGVSAMTVTNYWKRWFTLGIARPSSKYKGRFERAFSLEDLGIQTPSVKVDTKVEARNETESEEMITNGGEVE